MLQYSLHERDVIAWSQQQAELIRSGCLDTLDTEHLPYNPGEAGWNKYRNSQGTGRNPTPGYTEFASLYDSLPAGKSLYFFR